MCVKACASRRARQGVRVFQNYHRVKKSWLTNVLHLHHRFQFLLLNNTLTLQFTNFRQIALVRFPSSLSRFGALRRFPFSQKFRNFRFGSKWKTFFRFARLENSQKKWNCLEGSPGSSTFSGNFPVGRTEKTFSLYPHTGIFGIFDQMESAPGKTKP